MRLKAPCANSLGVVTCYPYNMHKSATYNIDARKHISYIPLYFHAPYAQQRHVDRCLEALLIMPSPIRLSRSSCRFLPRFYALMPHRDLSGNNLTTFPADNLNEFVALQTL